MREAIHPDTGGKVELNGTLWEAESSEEIAEGETVKVVKKDNLTLKVKKL